jgi:hypothetical protein
MSDPQRPKPLPARPPAPPPARQSWPPAPPPAPAGPSGPAEPPKPVVEPELEEVEVVGRGGTWIARVLGRSGRSGARSAPLLLLGFREAGAASAEHALESTVAARRLASLTPEALSEALERAKAPPIPGQPRPFFEEADSTRRSGPASEY